MDRRAPLLRLLRVLALAATLLLAAACAMVQPTAAPLGTEQNPVKLALVPSTDTQKVLAAGAPLTKLLEQETGLRFKVSVPTSYAAAIEAMGASNVDVGWLSPFAYILAHEKVGAEVLLTTVRAGGTRYTGQIITRVDSGITTLADLRGKRFAFVDPSSASGYLFPTALLKAHGIDPASAFAERIFAGGHDKVVIAVYNRQVDAGATYGDSIPATQGDARVTVQGTLPDVLEKVRVIAQTDPIPNDTIAVREGLPPELVEQVRDGLLRLAATEAGRKALFELYRVDGLAPVADADLDPVRTAARLLDLDLEQELAPGRRRG